MPNWCLNSYDVSHEDPAMIKQFVEAVREGNLFHHFVPISSGEWDYNTAVEEWGTKWDVCDGDGEISEDGLSASGWFNTAWGPGIDAYRHMEEEHGFKLTVLYHESGMCFAGEYEDGSDDYYEYDFDDEDWRDAIENLSVAELLDSEYENYLMWKEDEA